MSSLASLSGKRIVLGVCGGIAAYKSIELMRRMIESGAHVSPVLTGAALHFVGRTTFDALGSDPAQTSLWDEHDPIPHTRLGQNADLIVVVPATADLIAKFAVGIADDLLTTTLIATRAPVLLVAAMHSEMWQHQSVVANVEILRSRGVHVLDPDVGPLAGGDVGVGRLAPTDVILEEAGGILAPEKSLAGRRVLVSAGGTREPIDPVRFIGNRSSGKQAFAFARRALELGAEVVIVSAAGSGSLAGLEVIEVETASEMHGAVAKVCSDCDLIVMAAAVADFRPVVRLEKKVKKRDGLDRIDLEPTEDILSYLGSIKRAGQVIVGFAAETGMVEDEARRKLNEKNADFIVANDVTEPGAGFFGDTNSVALVGSDSVEKFGLASKDEIAALVLDSVVSWAFESGVWGR